MLLKELKINNFKNHTSFHSYFDSKFVCFVGENGIGKTNILDSIYYLSIAKSFFNSSDKQLIKHQENYFSIEGKFNKPNEDNKIFCAFMKGKKKVLKNNESTYKKILDHIGLFPIVFIAPQDLNLITEGSDNRRKFIDNTISQIDKGYLIKLVKYNKTLLQRNNLLKKSFERKKLPDKDLIDIYDDILDELSVEILKKRKIFVNKFLNYFEHYYSIIAPKKENVSIEYKSQIKDVSLKELLQQNFEKDYYLQRTNFGIHKDELIFSINDFPQKRFGSQGQNKSFVIALKLAKYAIIKLNKRFKPILIIDDITDRIDKDRVQNLLNLLQKDEFGQIFISDTDKQTLIKIGSNKIIELK